MSGGGSIEDKVRIYYREQLEEPHAPVMVAMQDETARLVGMGAAKAWLHADYLPPRSGELIDIWVDPEYRRKGHRWAGGRRLDEFWLILARHVIPSATLRARPELAERDRL